MKIIDALKKGQCLNKPATWKALQNFITVCIAIMPTILLFFPSIPYWLTEESLIKIGAAAGSINVYLTIATTDKMGL